MQTRLLHIAIMLMALLLTAMPASANDTECQSFRIDFRCGYSKVDRNFGNNREELARLVEYINQIEADSLRAIIAINLKSSASPEGPTSLNRRLSDKRLQALEEIITNLAGNKEIRFTRNSVGENIREMDSLKAIYGQDLETEKKMRLKLRYALAQVIVEVREPEPPAVTIELPEPEVPADTIEIVIEQPDTVIVEPEIVIVEAEPVTIEPIDSCRRHIYLKTNAIGWGMMVSNIAAEIEFGNNWSVTVPIYYSAMNYFKRELKFRTLTLQPEVRYWFTDHCTDRLKWYVGAHVGMGYYNYALDNEYRIQDHQGRCPAIGGGIGAGLRFNLNRRHPNRWKMEVTLGVGAYHCNYDKWHNTYPNGSLIAESVKKTFIGIDNAAVSVIYTFPLKKHR